MTSTTSVLVSLLPAYQSPSRRVKWQAYRTGEAEAVTWRDANRGWGLGGVWTASRAIAAPTAPDTNAVSR